MILFQAKKKLYLMALVIVNKNKPGWDSQIIIIFLGFCFLIPVLKIFKYYNYYSLH